MTAAPQKIVLARLRAALALVMLAVGWAFAPVALAFEPSNACSMICCVEDGYCCCNPRKPSVEGQQPDGSDHLVNIEVTTECPQGCTTPQYSSKLRQRDTNRAAIHIVEFTSTVATGPEQAISKQKSVESLPSSPRAPPSRSSL